MQVFDMDSHLREEYMMDEVYRLEGKFAHLTPVRLNDEKSVRGLAKTARRAMPIQMKIVPPNLATSVATQNKVASMAPINISRESLYIGGLLSA